MKLIFLFFVMDFLTILAYPIVFGHNKLRQFAKARIVTITGPVRAAELSKEPGSVI